MSKSIKILKDLEKNSILTIVPGLEKTMAEQGDVQVFDRGESVVKQGEPVFRLYLPLSDSLQLVRTGKEGSTEIVGYLQKNRTLCLSEILLEEKAPYSAVCEVPTKVLSIPAIYFKDYLKKYPHIERYLKLMTKSASIRVLKKFLEQNDVPTEKIIKIIAATELEDRKCKVGELLNLDSPGIILIENGTVILKPKLSQDPAENVKVGGGQWFGGRSLVPPFEYPLHAESESEVTYKVILQDKIKGICTKEILEIFYADPFVSTGLFSEQSEGRGGKIDSVPSTKVPASMLGSLNLSINLGKLIFAKDAFGSAVASIYNILIVQDALPSKSNIETDLQIFRKVSMLSIATVIEQFGFVSGPIKCTPESLAFQLMPGIIFYGNRFVVLVLVGKKSVIALDPVDGVVSIKNSDLREHWDGTFLEVTKAKTDFIGTKIKDLEVKYKSVPDGSKKLHLDTARLIGVSIVSAMKELMPLLRNRLALLLTTLVLAAMAPMITQFIVDEVLQFKNLDTVEILVIGSVLLTLFTTFIGVITKFNNNEFTLRYNHKTQSMYYRHALETAAESGEHFGSVQANFGQLAKIQSFTSGALFRIISDVVSVVIYSFFLLRYDWSLAATAFLVFPILFVIRKLYRPRLQANYEKQFELGSKMGSLATEQISSIMTVKAAAAEKPMLERWESRFVPQRELSRTVDLEMSMVATITSTLMNFVQVSCMYFGLKLVTDGSISLGEMFAVNIYVNMLIGPVTSLANMFDDIEEIKIAFAKITGAFKKTPQSKPENINTNHSVKLTGKLKIEALSFRYKSNLPWVLKDIDLSIYPRQIVAIVGPSGCGKSTLARIIAGQLSPTAGRMFFDDYESSMITRGSLFRQIGSVLQDSDLFSGSVLENIAFNDDSPSEFHAMKAAEQAGASEFIDKLPGKYNYFLAEGGLGLSGGQKQRISIARTIYSDPKILIMDEATSALDSHSEKNIMEQIRKIQHGRTTIIIAHRLSTIKYADTIHVLENGKIVEEGSHAHLIKKGGAYTRMFQNQSSQTG